jgi:tRNA-specific 2-thiouridylase
MPMTSSHKSTNMPTNLLKENQRNSRHNTRVAVALSGGVDSSVAAALLVDQGFDVIGMMMRLWSEPGTENENRCCAPDAIAQARRVADKLQIPFYVIDAQDSFYNQVVQYFIDGYTQGITPNPCLTCNRHVRWELLLNHALAFEAEFMATGHYARIQKKSGRFQLLRAIDKNKDQSYVLHVLNQQQLSQSMFPLGEFTKTGVRKMAAEFGLPVADRLESQDLCFLGSGNYREFLLRNSNKELEPGLIFDSKGNILGEHNGLAMYTIGQRRGLGLSSPTPLYVLDKDIKRNALVVGSKGNLGKNRLYVKDMNWISIDPPEIPIPVQVKVRYKAKEESATVHPGLNGQTEVHFEHQVPSITPGQAAVFYDGEICLGGGIIESADRLEYMEGYKCAEDSR